MKTLVTGLLILGMTNLVTAQSTMASNETKPLKLDEIILSPSRNVTYVNRVHDAETSAFVQKLELTTGTFDITKDKIYNNTFDSYKVTFENMSGNIFATYGKDGTLLNVIEKFKDTQLPVAVRNTIHKEFPDWEIHKTTYLVDYIKDKNVRKIYNIQISKENKKMNLKIESDGTLLLKK
jgi:NAD kinase